MACSKPTTEQARRDHEEEVIYRNKEAGLRIAGTLTLPGTEPPYPAVILISGSGPQDRNETIFGHRPFLVLADYLSQCGMAVLRCDDRGVGKSEGDYYQSTIKDFATDVVAGFTYLRTRSDIDPAQIGIIGHSEGGIVAPLAATIAPDIAFVVLMASTAMTFEDIFYLSNDLMAKAKGAAPETIAKQRTMHQRLYGILKQETNIAACKEQLRVLFHDYSTLYTETEKELLGFHEEEMDAVVQYYASPYVRFYLQHDPRQALMKVKCPVLSIIGEKDMQAPPDESNAAIEEALKAGGHSDYVVAKLPGLNHLLQTAQIGTIAEYATIRETIAPIALNTISDWIIERTNCTACKQQKARLEKIHRLNDFHYDRKVVSHLGCIKSCLDYLNVEVTEAWLYGGTGYAFILSIDEYFEGGGVSWWKKDKIHELGRNLGFETEIIIGHKSDQDFTAKAEFAWDKTREAIDQGYPCYGWELDIFLYYLISGYDETGYYYEGLFSESGKGPKPWQDLTKVRSDAFEMYIVKPGTKADDAKAIRQALQFALDFNRQPNAYADARCRTGLAAYDFWLKTLREGRAKGYGMAWYAAFWSECRKYGVPFLEEAKQRLSPKHVPLFDQAIEHYRVVSDCLSKLSQTFPYLEVTSEELWDIHAKDQERRQLGITLLETAREAESQGLEVLAKIMKQL